MGSPGRLETDRGEVYWGGLIDSCLITWLSVTGKVSDWKRKDSEQARATEGLRGHPACWAWGTVNALPNVSLTHSGRRFPTCSSAEPWPAAAHLPGLPGHSAEGHSKLRHFGFILSPSLNISL